jgi:GT2 family glycosyltransferase
MGPSIKEQLVSVVMPVHNALPHLEAAVRSILAQTFAEFEFVILDDGSTDGSSEQLDMWARRDSRVRVIRSEHNLGPAASSNTVVRHARGELIARMDADDISDPDRLRRQLELLGERRDAGLVGTLCDVIEGSGCTIRGPDHWRADRRSWFVPFPHGSIMYRRELFERIGGYREECVFWEDQDFVLRMSAQAKVLTIPAALYQHRHSRISTRLVSEQERVERSVDLMYRAMARLEQGRGYEDLLSDGPGLGDGKVDPRVFVSLGSLVLWAGGKPRLLRRLMRHGRLSADATSIGALAWAAWASLNPSSLRWFLKLMAKVRNRTSAAATPGEAAVEWLHPCELPAALAEVKKLGTEEKEEAPYASPRRVDSWEAAPSR